MNRNTNGMACRIAAVAGAAWLLLLSGCLERKESVRVDRDGGVALRVEMTGDLGDFTGGDSLPSEECGWRVSEETREKEDGGQERRLVATLDVHPGEPLPESFATDGDPARSVALRFPTTVKVERRRDGTYYHFKRTYKARQFARYNFFPKGQSDEPWAGKDPAELNDDDRRALLTRLRAEQSLKMCEFVRAGADALHEEWPQDHGLVLRRELLDYFDRLELDPLLALLSQEQSPERDAEVNRLGEEMLAGVRHVLDDTLDRLEVPRPQREKFMNAYETEQTRRGITEDLMDERWAVDVRLPGDIVAHNADRIEDGAAIWEFDAQKLMDRDVELMVTSRVERD